MPRLVDHQYLKEIDKARRELRALIFKKDCAPLMLRLAWQDAGTYDPKSKIIGGPNGSIRFEQALKRPENKGLDKAVRLCEEVMAKLKKVSYADLYQLAGVVAVEITGGPTIDFLSGRMDSDEPPQEGRLPDPYEIGVRHLRDIFTTRMGLSDQDIVALSGGHTLGKAHEQNTLIDKGEGCEQNTLTDKGEGCEQNTLTDKGEGCEQNTSIDKIKGQWTEHPWMFDNSYFVNLSKKDKKYFSLRTDRALVEDKEFRKYVEKYAKDKDAFFEDYAIAHKKLSELGCNLKNPFMLPKMPPFMLPKMPPVKLKLIKPKGIIGTVIVSYVILGYLRKRKNNQLKR